MSNRIFIKELRSVKDNGEYVNIKFTKGLNVISGLSETGKSYILQCINYLLGADKAPKTLKKYSMSYKYLLLSLEVTNGKSFVLKRYFSGKDSSKIYLYNCNIDKTENAEGRILNRKNIGEENLSDELLKILDLNNVILLKNKKTGENCKLSLRALLNFVLIDEVSIIKEESPVYKDKFDKTLKTSLLKYLISGKDNSKRTMTVDSAKVYKARYEAKIVMLDKLIQENILCTKNDNIDKNETKNLEIEFANLQAKIKYNAKLIDQYYNEKQNLQESIEAKENKYIEITRLLNKFNLLKEFYQKDLSRFDFIIDGTYYFNQLNIENDSCASCKNSINSCNCNIEEIKLSCEAEKQKINNNLIDIENVIKTANEEKNLLERELSIKRNDIKEIEIFLNNNLKPANELLKNSINSIIEKQNKIYKQEWNQTEIKRYQELKLECPNAIKSYKSSNFEQQISMDAYVKFTEYVADMLRKWKFITQTDFVEFNEKDMDIYINGEPRKNAGKGHRALTYSAFIISLLEFVDKHIGFVVIDSPLLNLKEIDENNPDIKPEIQNAFWKDLANIENNIQIIVIENKEPPKELQENINFIKFTKNANLGRRGFY